MTKPVDKVDIHKAKSRVGGCVRTGNLAGAEQARREMHWLQLLDHAQQVVASWPPPSPDAVRLIVETLPPVEVG